MRRITQPAAYSGGTAGGRIHGGMRYGHREAIGVPSIDRSFNPQKPDRFQCVTCELASGPETPAPIGCSLAEQRGSTKRARQALNLLSMLRKNQDDLNLPA